MSSVQRLDSGGLQLSLREKLPGYPWIRLLAHRIKSSRRVHTRSLSNKKIASTWNKDPTLSPPTDDFFDIIAGPIGDENGLGRSARYDLDYLNANGPPATIVDTTKSDPGELLRKIRSGRLAPPRSLLLLGQPDTYARTLTYLPPDFIARSWRVGNLVWEMPYCPQEWKFLEAVLHSFRTPSRYSAAAISSGLGLPSDVTPHKVKLTEPSGLSRAQMGLRKDAFVGLAIMDLRSCPARKNPMAHINAWKLAFGNDPNFQLLIKAQFTKTTLLTRGSMLRQLEKNVQLIEGRLTDADISALYRMSDVYLSLHRAEGFGLTIKEALETGVPTIATNWSAPAEYLNDYDHAFPLPFRMTPYRDILRHYRSDGLYWAEANVIAAAEILKSLAHANDRAH
ncbi:MAG: glycosyltransferase [Proteobacteria bacterium]|nr:glycosyltransferase [Pseudomonadota bacterium]